MNMLYLIFGSTYFSKKAVPNIVIAEKLRSVHLLIQKKVETSTP